MLQGRFVSERHARTVSSQIDVGASSSARILETAGYKQRLTDTFQQRSVTYDDNNDWHPRLSEQLVRLAALRRGQAVLDVGCGTGLSALAAAKAVGSSGRVVGMDISAAMLAKAQEKAKTAGLDNLELLQGDVESANFRAEFDVLLTSATIPYFRDVPSAFARFLTWLKPGGKFVCNTPQVPSIPGSVPFYQLMKDLHGLDVEDPGAPVGSKDKLEAALHSAGFSTVKITTSIEPLVMTDTSPMQYADKTWSSLMRFPCTPLDAHLSQQQQQALKQAFTEVVIEQSQGLVEDGAIVQRLTTLWADAQVKNVKLEILTSD